MTQLITVHGLVATTPRYLITADGLPIISFRLASSERHYDTVQKRWADGQTNWYTITAFKQLATNMNSSIEKGDRIFVQGDLRIKDWDNGERTGTSVELVVQNVGHDLSWGTSQFTRTVLVKESDEDDTASQLAEAKRELRELRETLAELSEEN